MSIFTIIKNCLLNKKLIPKDSGTSISIHIFDDGFYDIEFKLSSKTEQDAKKIGKILFMLNSGKLYDNFTEKLMDYAKSSDLETSEFMIRIIYNWGQYLKKDQNSVTYDDIEPMIKPSKVFSNTIKA